MGDIKISIPPPSPRQREFFNSRTPYTAFGGARGGGKSWAVRVKALLLALKYPGIQIIIVRKTYPELRSNHITQLTSLAAGAAVYSETKLQLSFINGSQIKFRSCRNASDADKFQGTEADVIFIDEATQLTEEVFDRIRACVRGVNSFPKRLYLTCNPGGVGHGWVKRLFIDRSMKPGEEKENYTFIKSLVTDNRALMEKDPDYIKKLESLPPKLKKAWLEGNWNIFEGQFFEEFTDDPAHYADRLYTHVIEPFEVPRSWRLYRSFDFGYSRPFSCDWWAVDGDGRAYLILQLYGATEPDTGLKWDPDRLFAKIRETEKEHRWLRGRQITGVADPSIWDASRGEAIIEAADRHCVFFQPGDNKRLPGWMQCHYRLSFREDGRPYVYFFNTCRHAIRTLPLLTYSPTCPEDLDTSQEDHFADSFRYFCMARPVAPAAAVTAKVPGADPLNLCRNDEKYKSFSY